MARVTARITNREKIIAALARLDRNAQLLVRRTMRLSGEAVRNSAVMAMRASKSGRTYTTHFFTDSGGNVRPIGTRPPHTASAPGEAPAIDTGTLAGSLDVATLEGGFAVEIGTNLAYGLFLEVGTSRIKPRPWLVPALELNYPAVSRAVNAAIRQAIRRSARRA